MGLLPALLLIATISAFLYLFLVRPTSLAVGAFLAASAAFVASFAPAVLGRYGGVPPMLVVAGVAVGVPALLGLAVLFRAKPAVLIWAIVLAMPLRVPVPTGAQKVFLLVPLYAVVLAGFLSVAGTDDGEPLWCRDRLRLPLAALICWAGLSLLWSPGPVTGTIRYLCFWVAFALMYHVVMLRLADERLRRHAVRALLGGGAVLAAIGIVQRMTGTVIYNVKVSEGYFEATSLRINSLFWDPNMFARFLVLVIVFGVVELFGRRDRVTAWLAGVAVGLALPALAFTYSRSGWLALGIVGVILAARLLGAWRAIVVAVVFVLVMVLAFSLIDTPQFNLPKRAGARLYWEKLFSGRLGLVEGGAAMFVVHPFVGVGLGAFPSVFPRYRPPNFRWNIVESHNSLMTVAAELGIVGLLLLAWFVVRYVRTARGALAARSADGLLGMAAVLSLVAIFIHSFFYGALFEDPFTWFLLGLATVLAPSSVCVAPNGRPVGAERIYPEGTREQATIFCQCRPLSRAARSPILEPRMTSAARGV